MIEFQIEILRRKEKPNFHNLVELDTGVVSTESTTGESAAVEPAPSVARVRELVQRSLDEYNKTHPRISLALYRVSMSFNDQSMAYRQSERQPLLA